jgi:hypothetical protein
VVSGPIDDPDYAKRPVGTNHLSVVLLDEAAFASDPSLGGFAGTWTLTKTADGVLVVSSIRDTPYPADRVANRTSLIAQARRGLVGSVPEQRIAALEILDQHHFLELVPDVISLLDDPRTANPTAPPQARAGRAASARVVKDHAR